ncbi:MAG: WD40/YVTN/BNR-like repeat-containing protein, partial [Bryobacteraceae bacterium]
LYAIAESPKQQGVIWTGSNDGQVNITRDGGKTWSNVTKNITGLPAWGTVMNVEPSNFDAGTAYIAVDLEQVGDYNAYVYETTDFGATWKALGGGVPKTMNSSAKCVREDPARKGMLYLGTNNALYVSWNDGGEWTRVRSNLPPAPVYWIEVEPRFHDLLIATHGRGIYDLDDVTPLRDWDKAQSDAVHLFPPRPTYRFRSIQTSRASEGGHVIGENPPYGADLNFSLKSAAPWTITIQDAENKTIRTLRGRGEAGINRVWWDLRYEGAQVPRMLTSPPDAPWLPVGPQGWRQLTTWGAGGGRGGETSGPRVAPGHFTVKLTVGEASQTAPIEILRDPNTLGTDADMKAQSAFLLQLQAEINDVGEMINHI